MGQSSIALESEQLPEDKLDIHCGSGRICYHTLNRQRVGNPSVDLSIELRMLHTGLGSLGRRLGLSHVCLDNLIKRPLPLHLTRVLPKDEVQSHI